MEQYEQHIELYTEQGGEAYAIDLTDGRTIYILHDPENKLGEEIIDTRGIHRMSVLPQNIRRALCIN